jgi:phosphate transport system permease protein
VAGSSEGGGPDRRLERAVRRSRVLGLAFRSISTATGVGLVALTALLLLFLGTGAAPEIERSGFRFLGGTVWQTSTGTFGAGPAIVGTVLTGGLALLFAVPVSLGIAVLSAEIAPRVVRGALSYVVELGAMVPSIVYGFWALVVLVPFLHLHLEPAIVRAGGGRLGFSGLPLGSDYLAAGAILGVMIVPTVAALSREALLAVPRERREAALALGATRWEAARLAVLGPARPGIVGAIVLGLGRALGEAIAVVLVIGNVYGFPTSLLSGGTTISSWIVNEFPDAFGLQRSALFELGLVLFGVSIALNFGARLVLRRRREGRDERPASRSVPLLARRRARRAVPVSLAGSEPGTAPARRDPRLRRRRLTSLVAVALSVGALAVGIYPLASLLRLTIENGGPAIVRPSFYVDPLPAPCYHNCSLGGIGPPIQGTLLLVGFASIVAVPIGLLAGIYLSEYARGRVRYGVGLVVDSLVGVPSILIGLFVFSLFFQFRPDLAQSAVSGGLALSALMVPIIARSTESALATVPASVRESGLALGFPRYRVTTRLVLGSSRGALVTGCLLALGRAAGETAALLFTVGWTQYGFSGWGQPVSAMPVFIYEALENIGTPNWIQDAWGAALLLLLLMLAVGLAARLSLRTSSAAMTE